MGMLQTHAPAIFLVIVFYFDTLSTVNTNTICVRFRFDPLPRAFLNLCVFGKTAQRISVDGRPKRFVHWCGRDLVSVMIYYHNHSCKSVHEPSFNAKLKMITTILRKFQILISRIRS